MRILGTEDGENLTGSSGHDRIEARGGSDYIWGLDGDDVVDAGDGDDFADGGVGDDLILGGAGNDRLRGGETLDADGAAQAGDDTINGGDGDDSIDGSYGDDVLNGGAGRDTLFGGYGVDVVHGGGGDDRIVGGPEYQSGGSSGTGIDGDLLSGDGGDDWIIADFPGRTGSGDVFEVLRVDGGKGYDTLGVSGPADVYLNHVAPADALDVIEAVGVEAISGQSNGVRVIGSAGDDAVDLTGTVDFDGGAGDDRADANVTGLADGGDGDDTISGGWYATVVGGLGDDRLSAAGLLSYADAASAVTLDLGVSTAQDTGGAGVDTVSAVRMLAGSAYADRLTGGAGHAEIDGGGGDDTIAGRDAGDFLDGGSGRDVLIGAGGDDHLAGGEGKDVLYGGGDADFIEGGNGADRLIGGDGDDVLVDGAGDDLIDGGDGVDYVDFYDATQAVAIDLADRGRQATSRGADIYRHIEHVHGSSFNDTLSGDRFGESLVGGSGDDLIQGRSGDDTLYGSDGADTVMGGDGDDLLGGTVVDGGAGVDTLLVMVNGKATVDLGHDGLQEIAEGVFLDVTGVENIRNDGYAAELHGDGGANRIEDNFYLRSDLFGEGGDDILAGGVEDVFHGGDGFDLVEIIAWASEIDFTQTRFIDVEGLIDGGVGTRIRGGEGDDRFEGRGGDDTLQGRAGDDTLMGGDGDDVMSDAGGGDDAFVGGAGRDVVDYRSVEEALTIDLSLTTAQDTGGAGHDALVGVEWLIGGQSRDTLSGSAANEQFDGRERNDVLSGRAGDDRLFGGDGDDTLAGGTGNDRISGGAGRDVADFSAATGALDLAIHDGEVTAPGLGTDVYSSIEGLIGSRFDDRLAGSSDANLLAGGRGDDTLRGGAGRDVFVHDDRGGHDVIEDFDLREVIELRAHEGYRRLEQVGDDTLVVLSGGESILLRGVQAASLGADNFQFYVPPEVDRLLVGDSRDDTLAGALGDDTLKGAAGDDSLVGGAGDDLLVGGAGADALVGGDGNDTVSFAEDGYIFVDLNNGLADTWFGGGYVRDQLSSVENLNGSSGTDGLAGDEGDNRLEGGGGSDVISGSGGADTIVGGAGNDSMSGGEGVDWLDYVGAIAVKVDLAVTDAQATGLGSDRLSGFEGLRGSSQGDTLSGGIAGETLEGAGGGDVLTGAGGADTFLIRDERHSSTAWGVDWLKDFNPGQGDRLDISQIDAIAGTPDDDAFVLVETFSGAAGEAVLTYDAGSNRTLFEADVDGDGIADLTVELKGDVGADAFVL
jgi:Ca2+-binding RTX toxin-like protein